MLVNKILQNLLSSASISDTGLDLALAPNLMNVLLENVVAKLLGDTFGFNDDVKAMFTLSSPYAKLSDKKLRSTTSFTLKSRRTFRPLQCGVRVATGQRTILLRRGSKSLQKTL